MCAAGPAPSRNLQLNAVGAGGIALHTQKSGSARLRKPLRGTTAAAQGPAKIVSPVIERVAIAVCYRYATWSQITRIENDALHLPAAAARLVPSISASRNSHGVRHAVPTDHGPPSVRCEARVIRVVDLGFKATGQAYPSGQNRTLNSH
jgi:hypothetical protein